MEPNSGALNMEVSFSAETYQKTCHLSSTRLEYVNCVTLRYYSNIRLENLSLATIIVRFIFQMGNVQNTDCMKECDK